MNDVRRHKGKFTCNDCDTCFDFFGEVEYHDCNDFVPLSSLYFKTYEKGSSESALSTINRIMLEYIRPAAVKAIFEHDPMFDKLRR